MQAAIILSAPILLLVNISLLDKQGSGHCCNFLEIKGSKDLFANYRENQVGETGKMSKRGMCYSLEALFKKIVLVKPTDLFGRLVDTSDLHCASKASHFPHCSLCDGATGSEGF